MSKPVSIETSKSRPLPPGWRWVRLGDCLTDVQPGIACGDKSLSEGIPHLRMNNISSDGRNRPVFAMAHSFPLGGKRPRRAGTTVYAHQGVAWAARTSLMASTRRTPSSASQASSAAAPCCA